MKKFALLFAAVFAFAAISCTPDNPDDPGKDDGKGKELTTLVSKASTWNVDKRVFDLSFSGEGVALATQLIGFDAELGAGKYKLVAEASAVAGDAVLEKTLLDSKAVSAGTVQVSKSGKKYTFKFNLTADGAEVTLSWSGDIDWPADPAPKKVLAQLLSAQANQSGEAAFTLSMSLGTAGIAVQQDESTGWQQVWTGEGGYLALAIDVWKKLGEYLVVKYNDGVVKQMPTTTYIGKNTKQVERKLVRPGFPEELKKEIANHTGNRYKMPN